MLPMVLPPFAKNTFPTNSSFTKICLSKYIAYSQKRGDRNRFSLYINNSKLSLPFPCCESYHIHIHVHTRRDAQLFPVYGFAMSQPETGWITRHSAGTPGIRSETFLVISEIDKMPEVGARKVMVSTGVREWLETGTTETTKALSENPLDFRLSAIKTNGTDFRNSVALASPSRSIIPFYRLSTMKNRMNGFW